MIDSQFNDIASLQILRWTHAQADSSRRSGTDDVAGQQSHELADIAYESGNIKNHFTSGTTLPEDAVNLQPHSQIAGILNLVTCCQKRSQRRECICTLPLNPLPATLQLKPSLRKIIVQSIASQIFGRFFPLDIAAFLSNHDGQLNLPIHLSRILRHDEIIVWPDQ